MRAATSVALIALLAAPAFAAPISSTPAEEEPSFGTQIISSAAGGAASGAVGNLLSEIESFFKRGLDERSTGALTNIVKQAQTLSAADKATVKTALVNKISTLQNPSKRLSFGDAAGKALGGLANEGAKTAVGGLLSDIENLFRRDDAELEARAPLSATGLGGSLLSSAAGGAASGLVGNLLGEIESLFRRDDAELEARAPLSATSLGGSLVSSAAGGAASGLVGNLLSEIESFFKRDVGLIFPDGSVPIIPVIREGVPLAARAPLSSTSLGGSLLSSAAGGAASGLVGNLLGEIESLFRRGVTDVHDEDLYVKRDASSITGIIKQAQTLSASDKATIKTALMNKIGTLQGKRDITSTSAGTGTGFPFDGISPLLTPQVTQPATSLTPEQMASLSSLFFRSVVSTPEDHLSARSPLSSTSLSGSLLSSAAGGAASGLVGNLLGEIESLFRRDIADGLNEELYAKRDTSSISSIIRQAQTLSASDKTTVKTALMSKIGTLQGKRDVTDTGAPFPFPNPLLTTPQVTQPSTVANLTPEQIASLSSLVFRSLAPSTTEDQLSARSPLSSTSLSGSLLSSAAGGAASGLVGNLLGEIESFFRRDAIEGPAELHAKRLSFGDAAGKALGGLANVGAKNAVDGLLTDIENLFRRGEPELEARAPLSATSLSGSLLSSAAGGAASGLVGNLLGEIESLFRRSEQLEIDELD